MVSSVDVREKNWSSDLQWNAVTNRHSRSVTHPCETKVIKQHLLQINLKASRSVTQSNTVYWNGILFQQFSYSTARKKFYNPSFSHLMKIIIHWDLITFFSQKKDIFWIVICSQKNCWKRKIFHIGPIFLLNKRGKQTVLLDLIVFMNQ